MLTARPHLAWALWRLPKFSATPQLGSFERTPILGVTFAFTRFYFGYFPAFFIKHLEQDMKIKAIISHAMGGRASANCVSPVLSGTSAFWPAHALRLSPQVSA